MGMDLNAIGLMGQVALVGRGTRSLRMIEYEYKDIVSLG